MNGVDRTQARRLTRVGQAAAVVRLLECARQNGSGGPEVKVAVPIVVRVARFSSMRNEITERGRLPQAQQPAYFSHCKTDDSVMRRGR